METNKSWSTTYLLMSNDVSSKLFEFLMYLHIFIYLFIIILLCYQQQTTLVYTLVSSVLELGIGNQNAQTIILKFLSNKKLFKLLIILY